MKTPAGTQTSVRGDAVEARLTSEILRFAQDDKVTVVW
jgi:hypothetical protein